MNKVLLLLFLSGMAQAKPLTKRAMDVISRHIAKVQIDPNHTKEEMEAYYREGKVIKLYDLVIYELLIEAGLQSKTIDYTEAILQVNGWVTVEIDSIVYAYPGKPPNIYEKYKMKLQQHRRSLSKWFDRESVDEVYEDHPEIRIWRELEQILENDRLAQEQRNRMMVLKLRELNKTWK